MNMNEDSGDNLDVNKQTAAAEQNLQNGEIRGGGGGSSVKQTLLKKFRFTSDPLKAGDKELSMEDVQIYTNSFLVVPTFGNYNSEMDDIDNIIVPTINSKNRDQWTNKIEYMLSVIGYVVDLGNCVRFPYVCYKNGGGAFLIPYFIFLFIIGIPMMYMEMSVGQFFRVGNITLWSKVNIYMKGIGYASLLVVSYITLYYTTIISYSVFYLFASFSIVMPWASCNNEWNTEMCLDQLRPSSSNLSSNQTGSSTASNKTVSPAEEYFYRHMLGIHQSTGIDNLGPIKFDLTVCLALVYLLMYVCICKGVKSTGKAVYVTAVLPYVILIGLLCHGLTLEGSGNGVAYFITPSFNKLGDFECWKDAAIQIFFTLGPGISVLTTYASYSKFNNNCQIDAICASVANVIASFLAGVVVFASLGHLSYHVGKPISEVTQQDLGLSFIAYPEMLATFRYSAFFSVIFFLMIINLGLDSGFGGLEAIYTALADEFVLIKKYRKSAMAAIHFILFLGSLPTVTYGGMYLVTFLDTFSTSPALMVIVFFECISVSWVYGIELFTENINKMFGVRPHMFWRICWQYVNPAIILVLFFVSIVMFEEPVTNEYKYPFGFLVFGWFINISVMLPIPIYAIFKCFFTKNAVNN